MLARGDPLEARSTGRAQLRFGTTIAGVGEPTFILIHGLASSRRIWDLVVPHLSREHKVIAFDLRGHGETEKPEEGYALEELAEDIDELMRRHGITRPVLVGHSAGANVALHHATTRGAARGIVLVDGALVEIHAHLAWEEASKLFAPPLDDTHQIEKFVREGWPEVTNTPQLVEVRRSFFEWGKGGEGRKRLTRERHLALLRSLWGQDVHAELGRLRCRAVMVACRMPLERSPDQRWSAQKALAAARVSRLPQVDLRWFEESIHDVPVQRPRELADLILAFAGDIVAAERSRELAR